MSMKNYYTIQRLADEIGITKQAAYLRVKQGQIKTVEIAGRMLIPESEFRRWRKADKYDRFKDIKKK